MDILSVRSLYPYSFKTGTRESELLEGRDHGVTAVRAGTAGRTVVKGEGWRVRGEG